METALQPRITASAERDSPEAIVTSTKPLADGFPPSPTVLLQRLEHHTELAVCGLRRAQRELELGSADGRLARVNLKQFAGGDVGERTHRRARVVHQRIEGADLRARIDLNGNVQRAVAVDGSRDDDPHQLEAAEIDGLDRKS